MPTFSTPRDAKEFLIDRILSQAQRDGVSLSDVERKMLYFSETGWTLPDMGEINREFDCQYNQFEFEAKIGGIVRRVRSIYRTGGADDDWKKAVRILRKEDHYLLVLIDAAGPVSRLADRIKLVLAAFALVGAVVAAGLLFGDR